MIKKVELESEYSVCVENDIDKKKTMLGVAVKVSSEQSERP